MLQCSGAGPGYCQGIQEIKSRHVIAQLKYEGYSKINLLLACIHQLVTIATWCMHSCNMYLFALLYTSLVSTLFISVWLVTDKTWSLSLPLPPAVRCVVVLLKYSIYVCSVPYPELLDSFGWRGSRPIERPEQDCLASAGSVDNCPEPARCSRPITIRT